MGYGNLFPVALIVKKLYNFAPDGLVKFFVVFFHHGAFGDSKQCATTYEIDGKFEQIPPRRRATRYSRWTFIRSFKGFLGASVTKNVVKVVQSYLHTYRKKRNREGKGIY